MGRKEGTPSHGILTHKQIAKIMTERGYKMNKSRVGAIERSALKKMAESIDLKELAEELGITLGEEE